MTRLTKELEATLRDYVEHNIVRTHTTQYDAVKSLLAEIDALREEILELHTRIHKLREGINDALMADEETVSTAYLDELERRSGAEDDEAAK